MDASDTYFGKTYEDPYRWLENLKDPDVEAWFKAQAKLTDDTISKIPGRNALLKEWLALDKLKPAAYSGIDYENGCFTRRRGGRRECGKLYWREGWNGGTEKLSCLTQTRTKPQRAGHDDPKRHSFVGRENTLCMALFIGWCAEWSELRVLDVSKGTLLPDSIYPSWGAFGWMKDGKSFFYDATKVSDIKSIDIELNNKTRVHKLGTPALGRP